MKTAISIPDEIFEAGERAAQRLRVSRSELYATAMREFIERHRHADVTAKLDQVYAADESASALDTRLQALQAQSLDNESWE